MTSPGPIVTTKLWCPEMPPMLLRRPRLSKALDAGSAAATTLVVAPAGFGKTVAVADWARHSEGTQVAWLTLDAADKDPLRFWRHLLAAISHAHPDALPMSRELVEQGTAPEGEHFAAVLINELCSITGDLRIVLDDFESIADSNLVNRLAYVIETAPPNVHFVICSRVMPDMPLGRWRAAGLLSELTADDLRFSEDEAGAYLDVLVAGDLTTAQLDLVIGRADGWIAAIYLTAVGVQRARNVERFLATLGHSEGPIGDYVVGEVLRGLTDEMRSFLLKTSLLSGLSPEVCDAAMSREDSALMLRALEGHGLFVMRNNVEGESWHYHPLFRDVLQSLARAELGPESVTDLHRSAAAAYRRAGAIAEAISHGIQSGDFELSRTLIDADGPTLLRRDPRRLSTLLAAVPDGVMGDWPKGRELELWAATVKADVDGVRKLKAREALLADPSLAPLMQLALDYLCGNLTGLAAAAEDATLGTDPHLAAAGAGLVATAYDRYEKGAQALRAALADEETAPLSRVLLTSLLAWNRVRVGALGEALAYATRAIEISAAAGMRWLPAVRWAELAQAHVAYDRGELEAAYRGVTPVVETTAIDACAFVEARILAAQVHWALGQRNAAAECLGDAMATPTGPASGVSAQRVTLFRAMHCIKEGDLVLAAAWLPDWKTRLMRGPESELERLVLARYLIAKGREDEAQALLSQPQQGDCPPSIRYAIEASKMAALAAAHANDATAPLLFEIALSMAEPEGLVQTFVDDAAALSSVRRPGDSGVWASVGPVQHALAGERAMAATRPRNAVLPQLIEELTEREVSVLHYLPTRMTNLEIGRELFISSNTVKTHLKAIYRKLGVGTRDDAVAVAVNLRLV